PELWKVYLRTYEILWSLPRGTLAVQPIEPRMEADAGLCARLVRTFARDWLEGAGKFAVLCLTYLLGEKCPSIAALCGCGGWCDTIHAGKGSVEVPGGLIDIDPNEAKGIIHPMYDPELSGFDLDKKDIIGKASTVTPIGGSQCERREPFEYGQILRALGMDMPDHDIAVRYYKERAAPYLVKFPVKKLPRAADPLPEGLETWDITEPLEKVDWLESVLSCPVVVPGMTTRQRFWGTSEGGEPEKRPIDLDIYVDCSGSMPNPQHQFSPVALAGAIIALSALRVGSAVQATLWSGAGEFETTGAFVRDTAQVLRVLTGYLGGGTAFPIHILRDTYEGRKLTDRSVHILNLSDDGITTMFDKDERRNSGWDISAMALKNCRAGGSMVLNLWSDWKGDEKLVRANQQGWDIYVVRTLEELVPFARAFSQSRYAKEKKDGA
ncbi:MAG TPA: hypothetical protein VKE74_31130, partial [Gemmataceae bacterium]|nr:hypothetical protein [Gemmataceae bacterium]